MAFMLGEKLLLMKTDEVCIIISKVYLAMKHRFAYDIACLDYVSLYQDVFRKLSFRSLNL